MNLSGTITQPATIRQLIVGESDCPTIRVSMIADQGNLKRGHLMKFNSTDGSNVSAVDSWSDSAYGWGVLTEDAPDSASAQTVVIYTGGEFNEDFVFDTMDTWIVEQFGEGSELTSQVKQRFRAALRRFDIRLVPVAD